ncbi:DUF4269 domain-containing protein [Soonwooa sp.]|uniref:DUF4269 domain-containing protein n=1 Tax=Soonwooa sp. TaxID=1938592 RepID=UPI00344AEB3A
MVGTIPIAIDIQNSDLDIICYVEDQKDFVRTVEDAFQAEKDFSIRHLNDRELPAIVANFFIDDFEIEIFGQAVPSIQQAAYKHMLIEDYLLKKYGEAFRQQIITLKKQGYKTEPAFALLLGLEGNPYTELLKISTH